MIIEKTSFQKRKLIKYIVIAFLILCFFRSFFRHQIPVFLPHQEKTFTQNISKKNIEPDITVIKNNPNISVTLYTKDGEFLDSFSGKRNEHSVNVYVGGKYRIIAKNDSNHIIFGYVSIYDND